MNKLLIICGPTATGKTNLALTLAKEFHGEIVSCDSRQVYKEMDIVTGKDIPQHPKPEIVTINDSTTLPVFYLNSIPLWMYDVVSPDQEFSVSAYEHLATAVIADIHKRGKLPIVVGGTGLYLDAVVSGIQTSTVPKNNTLRKQLDNMFVVELQQMLQALSPTTWEALNNSDRNNPRRLIRKIEIVKSEIPQTSPNRHYNTLWLGLTVPSEIQEERIKQRVVQRMQRGALEEIKYISKKYSISIQALQTIGYQEWNVYLHSPTEIQYNQAIQQWQTHEIQYAKRQMTWFKRNKEIVWISMSDKDSEYIARKQVQSWYNLKSI